MFATPCRWRSPILKIQAKKVELLSFPGSIFCSINLHSSSKMAREALIYSQPIFCYSLSGKRCRSGLQKKWIQLSLE